MLAYRNCVSLALALGILLSGCHSKDLKFDPSSVNPAHYRPVATTIEYPEICKAPSRFEGPIAPPQTIEDIEMAEYWDLSLEEAIRIALENSDVFRDIGGRVVSSPQATGTVYDPALAESNPNTGVEAALSAFDTRWSTRVLWARTENPINFTFGGLTPQVAVAQTGNFSSEFNKTAATGTQFALRNNTSYEWNNNPNNLFPSVWNTNFEAEFRQPLLQGAGIKFNRIAGPSGQPGLLFTNGVLIARTNTDISIAEFENAVRNFVSDVENAYWDLYFAYRNLQAAITARDAALQLYNEINARFEIGAQGGSADQVSQALQQYYQFLAAVEEALSGRPTGSTVTGGAGGGGAFAGSGGVLAREANLRLLMGLPLSDGRLIRPSADPPLAKVRFDWEKCVLDSLTQRVELRRQKWQIKRRELELVAAKNFLLPRLDATGLYRWRGFGDELLDYNNPGDIRDARVGFDNAFESLTRGDLEEWQLGLNFDVTIGFRQAHAAVRNAELQLARERALLRDQELTIVHELGAAFRELERAQRLSRTNFNRWMAAISEVRTVRDQYEVGQEGVTLRVLLDAQSNAADAEVNFYRSIVEYNLAIKNVHFSKGTLLEYNGVKLAEGGWDPHAYADAIELSKRFGKRELDYGFLVPGWFAGQPVEQVAPKEALGEPVSPEPAEELPRPMPEEPQPPRDQPDQANEMAAGDFEPVSIRVLPDEPDGLPTGDQPSFATETETLQPVEQPSVASPVNSLGEQLGGVRLQLNAPPEAMPHLIPLSPEGLTQDQTDAEPAVVPARTASQPKPKPLSEPVVKLRYEEAAQPQPKQKTTIRIQVK